MEIKTLRYFLAVAREESMTKACWILLFSQNPPILLNMNMFHFPIRKSGDSSSRPMINSQRKRPSKLMILFLCLYSIPTKAGKNIRHFPL